MSVVSKSLPAFFHLYSIEANIYLAKQQCRLKNWNFFCDPNQKLSQRKIVLMHFSMKYYFLENVSKEWKITPIEIVILNKKYIEKRNISLSPGL